MDSKCGIVTIKRELCCKKYGYVDWHSPYIRIYADGSCPKNSDGRSALKRASWAIYTTALDPYTGEFVAGTLEGGSVVLRESQKGYLSATVATNQTAEMSAIAQAFIYLLRVLRFHEKHISKVTIFTGSQLSINIIEKGYTSERNKDLQNRLLSLYGRVLKKHQSVHINFVHSKGHNHSGSHKVAENCARIISSCNCRKCLNSALKAGLLG